MQTIRVLPATAIALVALAGLLAHAQAPAPPAEAAPAAPAAPTRGEQFLDVAVVKVRAMERVASTIVQTVDMLNQKFSLKGHYYKDTGNRVSLKLELAGLGETDATMEQVCDGNILWDYQKVLQSPSYRKRDIKQIMERLKNPALDDAFRTIVIANLGFGGPESLLIGLRKAVKFDQYEETKDEAGRDVVIIRGAWQSREGLTGPGERPLSPTAPLPSYVPSNVQVTLGKEDYWPYRVKLYGNAPSMVAIQEDTRPIGQDGRPIGVKRPPPKITPSSITLDYTLRPASEIKPEVFVFKAPAEPPADDTEEFLTYLDAAITAEAERKKAEAAKAEGEPLLKDSLLIPKPDPAANDLGTFPKAETPK